MNIAWPALLRLTGDAELQVVLDQQDWNHDSHLHATHYLPTDVLIDAAGQIYGLQHREGHLVVPRPTGHAATLDEIVTAVQAHSAQAGSCCAVKFSANSIREAIAAIATPRCPG